MNFSQALEAINSGKEIKRGDNYYSMKNGKISRYRYSNVDELIKLYDDIKHIDVESILAEDWEVME